MHITEPLIDSSVNQGLHVCNPVKERLVAMSDAILKEEWVRFQILFEEVKDFKPSRTCINGFAREEMRSAVARNISMYQLEVLRKKLAVVLKADEKEVEDGYQHGLRALQALQGRASRLVSQKYRPLMIII